MALAAAVKEGIWLRQLMKDLGWKVEKAIPVLVDNQSCIALAKNPEYHARTKHIDIQHHFTREKVAEGLFDLVYCPTKEMVADAFTKPLPKEKHFWCAEKMGLHQA